MFTIFFLSISVNSSYYEKLYEKFASFTLFELCMKILILKPLRLY